jgi:hypothetical protein
MSRDLKQDPKPAIGGPLSTPLLQTFIHRDIEAGFGAADPSLQQTGVSDIFAAYVRDPDSIKLYAAHRVVPHSKLRHSQRL